MNKKDTMELEVEVSTLIAIAEAIESGNNEPEAYTMAIQGVANRITRMIGENVA